MAWSREVAGPEVMSGCHGRSEPGGFGSTFRSALRPAPGRESKGARPTAIEVGEPRKSRGRRFGGARSPTPTTDATTAEQVIRTTAARSDGLTAVVARRASPFAEFRPLGTTFLCEFLDFRHTDRLIESGGDGRSQEELWT